MSDSRLKQLLKDKQLPHAPVPAASPSVISRVHPYLLDLQQPNGNRMALPYTSLLFLSFNPSDGIVAMFATHTVRISGICLEPIYQALAAEAVGTLKAVGNRLNEYPEGTPLVQTILITKRTGVDKVADDA